MPKLPPKHKTPHRPSRQQDRREYDQRRGSARQRGYTWRWEKVRDTYLKRNPLCVMCRAQGNIEPATVVDHITPHQGDQTLFWDPDNWQPLCKTHHDRDKQVMERGGKPRTQRVGADGWPDG